MSEYLILIASPNRDALTSAEEEKCIVQYGKWAEALAEKHIVARRLSLDEGQMIPSKKNVTTDGPFIEAKELIAGFVLIEAKNDKEARSIAASCPLNQYFHLFVKKTN
ncbi:YciI family protein [Ekhidna sp.]|uniref:YciI family protein n=1 Tax=Ekhidna sp. TaxID=2608089 RepID=UPI00329808E8